MCVIEYKGWRKKNQYPTRNSRFVKWWFTVSITVPGGNFVKVV